MTDDEMIREIAITTGEVLTASRLRDWARKEIITRPEAGGGKGRKREWPADAYLDAVAAVILNNPEFKPNAWREARRRLSDIPGIRRAGMLLLGRDRERPRVPLELEPPWLGDMPGTEPSFMVPRVPVNALETLAELMARATVLDAPLWWLTLREAARQGWLGAPGTLIVGLSCHIETLPRPRFFPRLDEGVLIIDGVNVERLDGADTPIAEIGGKPVTARAALEIPHEEWNAGEFKDLTDLCTIPNGPITCWVRLRIRTPSNEHFTWLRPLATIGWVGPFQSH